MANLHARVAPSSLKRTINCLGSLRLIEQLIARGLTLRNTLAAQQGTAAHAAAEQCLNGCHDAIEMVGRTFEGIEVDEFMAENIQIYLDLCRAEAYQPDRSAPYQHGIEHKIRLDQLQPPEPVWGTADFWVFKADQATLTVIDYKNGYHLVEATDNDQGRCYALGVWLELADPHIKCIEVVICQPNASHPEGIIRRERISIEELCNWWHTRLLPALYAMLEPDASLKAGEWCTFCPAFGACPEAQRHAIEQAQLEFAPGPGPLVVAPPNPETLSLEQLERIWLASKYLKAFLTAANTELFHRLNTGVAGEHTKLAVKRGHRKWALDEESSAATLLALYSVTERQIYQRKLRSPTQVEKLLPKAERAALKGIWTKPSIGASIVPIEDKREAISNVAQALFAPDDEG